MPDIKSKYEELMDLYEELKREIRNANPLEYERWKAGGFLIDPDIMSMYPHMGDVVYSILEEKDKEEEENG